MKKYIIAIALLSFLPSLAKACDICGCGVGGGYVGILPNFYKHIFGVRYRYNSMLTHIGAGGSTTYLTTKERYHTAEVWGGWNIGSKFRVMAAIPYNFNERINEGITKSKNGIGDINVSAYYQLVNSTKTTADRKLLVQSLWLGGGIKMATGKYNPADKSDNNINTNLFQLGTGSYDFNITAMYDVRLQDAGININTNYKINTANKYDYRYGNKFDANAQVYYKFRLENGIMIAPNAGVQYEKNKNDLDNGFNVTVSGGNVLLGTLGVETTIKKIAIGANFQTPLSQNLANGIIKANNRAMVHVAFTL